MTGKVVVLIGPSGVGKTSIRESLMIDKRIFYSVSATTRPPRAGEMDGKDYHFLSETEFKQKLSAGELLEYTKIYGHYYGTLRKPIDDAIAAGKIPLLDLDHRGAQALKEKGYQGAYIFILPPAKEDLKKRLQDRKTDDPETVRQRLAAAEREIELAQSYQYRVVNDNLQRAVREIWQIIEKEVLSSKQS
jgi:guanylate kinase